MTTLEITTMQEEIRALAAERDAVILAHNYQVPEVQDVADYVGDSLGLSREAAATDADAIVFCGVHFMAETAAILSPQKTVLIPDLDAGCSLAASITRGSAPRVEGGEPRRGRRLLREHDRRGEGRERLLLHVREREGRDRVDPARAPRSSSCPDMFLGLWLEKVTGRKLRIWMGECHVHAGIRPQDITRWQADAPDAEFLVHPECGCASQCMAFGNEKTHILSTEGMINFARRRPRSGSSSRPRPGSSTGCSKEAPEKRFEAVSEKAICRYMKMITLPKLRDSLRDWKFEVTVPDDIAERARGAIDRMVAIS